MRNASHPILIEAAGILAAKDKAAAYEGNWDL
jgi:hypothetical protein